jgi:hypothetical protein
MITIALLVANHKLEKVSSEWVGFPLILSMVTAVVEAFYLPVITLEIVRCLCQ